MKQILFLAASFLLMFSTECLAQEKKDEKSEGWKVGGAMGLDFSQLLLINPKVGAGENRIGIGANTNFYGNYTKGRLTWKNAANLSFTVQKLGKDPNRPFQKSLDELRLTSTALYNLTKDNPLAYALDVLALTQLTPTYKGNFLSPQATGRQYAIAKFFSPATIVVSPGIAYKPDEHLSVLISPASLKVIAVPDDSIAVQGNEFLTNSIHGNPLGRFASEEAFRQSYGIRPSGKINDSTYFANNFIQMGATVKGTYQNKFLKDKEGKARLGLSTTLTLYTNYLRDPQNIDVEWISQVDLYIFKGLSLTLTSNLFYDHDILVQVDRDNNRDTGVNGYESTGRRISFIQTLLLKYNFLF